MTHNHLVRLKSRPRGLATRDNFTLAKEPIPDLRDGEIAVETKFISLDPAMRLRRRPRGRVAPCELRHG
jgi:NADPH-dependent curcumin reductase CurA